MHTEIIADKFFCEKGGLCKVAAIDQPNMQRAKHDAIFIVSSSSFGTHGSKYLVALPNWVLQGML